jgi:carboxypeptidase Q
MKRASAVLVALAASLPFLLAAPRARAQTAMPAAENRALAAVAGRALLDSRANQELEYLSDEIGGRVTGSPAANKAIAWALEEMRKAGLQDVHEEPWTLEHGWTRGFAHLRILGGANQVLHADAMGWTGSTPAGGLDAGVIAVNAYHLRAAERDAAGWRGKVLLLRPQGAPPKNAMSTFTQLDGFLKAAYTAGAAAVIAGQGAGLAAGMNLTHTGVLGFNTVYNVPVVNLTAESQSLLQRLMDRAGDDAVRIHVDIQNTITGPVPSADVVGEVRGTSEPNEVVVIGGHLDSWDLSAGATDDGTGAMAALAAARAIAASGYRPKRTVRVVLFTGEEQGLLGSQAYVKRHAAEMKDTVAALILDEGQGPIDAMQVGGHDAVIPELEPLAAMLAGFGSPRLNDGSSFGTDSGPFILAGVPGINLSQNSPNYRYTHHSIVDTFDHVRHAVLIRNAAELAVMAFYIADRAQRLDAPWTPAQVKAELEKQGLEAELRAFGLWNFGN